MLAALLPLLEGLGAEGGLLSGLGSSAGGGLESLGARFGFARAFGGQAEMGDAIRRMHDVTSMIQDARKAIDENKQRQAEIANKAREDDPLNMSADPRHKEQLAQLEAQNQATQRTIQQHQRELSVFNSRMFATQNPTAASFQKVATVTGAVAAAGFWGKSLITHSPVGAAARASWDVAKPAIGQTNASVIEGMTHYAGSFGDLPKDVATHPFSSVMGELVVKLSKLPGLLKNWSEALIDSKQHLAQFSPAIAYAASQAQSREFQRNFLSGRETGGNIAELSNRMQTLLDVVRPASDQVTNVLANILSAGITKVTELAVAVRSIHTVLLAMPIIGNRLRSIENILAAKSNAGPTEMPFATFLNNAQRSAVDRFRSED